MAKPDVTIERLTDANSIIHAVNLGGGILRTAGYLCQEVPELLHWLQEEEGMATELVELNTGKDYVRPFYREHPGTVALWAQIKGATRIRVGGTRQRRRPYDVSSGDVVAIMGTGKRGFENPWNERSIGLLIDVIPVDLRSKPASEIADI